MFDRNSYFNSVRDALFEGALTQQQVDGQNVILALWEHGDTGTPMTDMRWLAYMLSTAYHETAQRMWPIEEYGKGSSHSYGQPDPATGQTYYGRGFVQLTHKENYDNASKALGLIDDRDLVWHPQMALDSLIAARVMFRGMAEGWFTGRKLGQYFDDETDDPVNARQIINGNDCDTKIAAYHQQFLQALEEAWVDDEADPVTPSEPVELSVPKGLRVIVNGLVVEP
jgi:putative chitinase